MASGLAVLFTAACLLFAAAAAASPPYVQFADIPTPAGAESEFFSESVAVNPHNGHIYLADSHEGKVYDYESTSDTSPEVWEGFGGGKVALAVDNISGDVYISDSTDALIKKFDADGTLITSFGDTVPTPNGQLAGLATPAGSFSPAASLAFGLAVDQTTGDLYVIDAGHQTIDVFDESGGYKEAIPATTESEGLYGCGGAYTDAIAVNDTTGELLAADSCDLHLYRFELATGAFLGSNDGSETPDGSFGGGYISVAVDQANGNVFVADSSHEVIDEFDSAHSYVEPQVHLGPESFVRSVAIDPETGDVYAPDQNHGNVRVFQIKQPAQPVAIASVTDVTDTTAALRGGVNPEGLPTTYHFEYISQADWQANGESFAGPHLASVLPVPDASAGSGEAEVQTAPQSIGALTPSAAYRYHLIATNSLSPAAGTSSPEGTFTTQPATASMLLPDERGYELVSPPDKHGAPLEGLTGSGGIIQAAEDGSGLAYIAKGPIDEDPAGNRSSKPSQLLSRHTGAGSWSTEDIATPHRAPAGVLVGSASEYQLFSSDLSHGAVQPVGATPLSPLASEYTPYLREVNGSYTPLVYPGNVPAGTKFGGEEAKPELFGGIVHFVTAAPDFRHVLLRSPASLVQGFENEEMENVYEWSKGELTAVSILPNGAPSSEEGGAVVGNTNEQLRGAISTDGNRAFFTTSGGRLYMRDIARAETLRVDASAPGVQASEGNATFQWANNDGSKVLFTDDHKLTKDATAVSAEPDLYECEVVLEGGKLACELTDLSVDTHPGEAGDVLGTVIGADEAGRYVYFAAKGALEEGAAQGACPQPGEGQCVNLYVYDTVAQSRRLVAVLSSEDFPDWHAGDHEWDLGLLTSRVSPDGHYLAFMSQRPLTGYDNRDAVSGQRDEEVFLYDSGSEALRCASCDPTGARPTGVLDESTPGPLIDRPGAGGGGWRGHWLAASIPGWVRVDEGRALYQPRYLSDSGRLFFNTPGPLSPADVNGTQDVYQFEPSGIGGCTETSQAFSDLNGGCVDLVSSGTSPEESAFLDASESGADVFFLTAARLTGKDIDNAYDAYDAHVGGGEAQAATPVECSGDACQQPAVPPNHPTPGTLLLDGPENALECPKGKRLQKGKCVKKKNKRRKSNKKKNKGKKAKRIASHNRGDAQ